MPFEPHANLKQPDDENAYIWRFLSLPKFLDLLETSSLHFCRGDQFEDPYEGLLPDDYVEVIRRGGSTAGSVQTQARMARFHRFSFYANCWHRAEHEPAGMWKLYAGDEGGVAIRSTYSRLKAALNADPRRLYLCEVSYESSHVLGSWNPFKFMTHKRPSFSHEREVRALHWQPDQQVGFVDSETPQPAPDTPTGIRIPVDLAHLLVGVVISPTAPDWYSGLLAKVMERLGCKVTAEQSTLYVLKYPT